MPRNTLTSLAILKVNVDHNRDYIDYLSPFIRHVLIQEEPQRITDDVVSHLILKNFGLEIPGRVVHIVLKRIARQGYIERNHGVYRKTKNLHDPQLESYIAAAKRHINSIVQGLQKYSQGTISPIAADDAVTAICRFLTEFDITCLRSYLRGTAIPDIQGGKETDIVLVSDYVKHIQMTAPERFESFIVLVQGHMLANALTCPDLNEAPKNYKNVTFYCDTPLLVRALGAEGVAKKKAACELITLVTCLGGRFAVFSHSIDELNNVLVGASNYVNRPEGRGAIVDESRRNKTTKSDLIMLAESVDSKLISLGIDVVATPKYIHKLQIDETAFEHILDDEVAHYNPRAKQYDINSVRSIYVLRDNEATHSLEKTRAALVTTNSAFAEAAWEYGKRYESSREVSSVITDFTLANMAWLKSPMKTPAIPKTQLLSFSYAALQPSEEWLRKYLSEIDRLEKQKTITVRDHQLLRSSPIAYRDLMHMTLGEETALTQETITDTLTRVEGEVKREEAEKLALETQDHRKTREALVEAQQSQQQVVKRIHAQCQRQANRSAWGCSAILAVLLALGLVAGVRLGTGLPFIAALPIGISSAALLIMTFLNLLLGVTVRELQRRLSKRILGWMIRRQSAAIGVDIEIFGQNDGN